MKKRIRLLDLNERSWLEQNLNEFIRDHENVEINVWTDDDKWRASVRYSDKESPTYCNNVEKDEI